MSAPNGQLLTAEQPPRLALTRQEAAQALGISVDSFERHVQPELRCTYLGARRIYSIDDLRRWLERSAVSPNGMEKRDARTLSR